MPNGASALTFLTGAESKLELLTERYSQEAIKPLLTQPNNTYINTPKDFSLPVALQPVVHCVPSRRQGQPSRKPGAEVNTRRSQTTWPQNGLFSRNLQGILVLLRFPHSMPGCTVGHRAMISRRSAFSRNILDQSSASCFSPQVIVYWDEGGPALPHCVFIVQLSR